MKKVLAIFISLFFFAGANAQTTPAAKKETTKPVVTTVPLKINSTNTTLQQTYKPIKSVNIKKSNAGYTISLKDAAAGVLKAT